MAELLAELKISTTEQVNLELTELDICDRLWSVGYPHVATAYAEYDAKHDAVINNTEHILRDGKSIPLPISLYGPEVSIVDKVLPMSTGPMFGDHTYKWAPFGPTMLLNEHCHSEDDCEYARSDEMGKIRYVPWRAWRAPCDYLGYVVRAGYDGPTRVLHLAACLRALKRKMGDIWMVVEQILGPFETNAIRGLSRVMEEWFAHVSTPQATSFTANLNIAMVRASDWQHREDADAFAGEARATAHVVTLQRMFETADDFVYATPEHEPFGCSESNGEELDNGRYATATYCATDRNGGRPVLAAITAAAKRVPSGFRAGRAVVGIGPTIIATKTACGSHDSVGRTTEGFLVEGPAETAWDEQHVGLYPTFGARVMGVPIVMDEGSVMRNGYLDGVSAQLCVVDPDKCDVLDTEQLVTATQVERQFVLYYVPVLAEVDERRRAPTFNGLLNGAHVVVADEVFTRQVAALVLWEKHRSGWFSDIPDSWSCRDTTTTFMTVRWGTGMKYVAGKLTDSYTLGGFEGRNGVVTKQTMLAIKAPDDGWATGPWDNRWVARVPEWWDDAPDYVIMELGGKRRSDTQSESAKRARVSVEPWL